MYGIYANIGGILMGSMSPYIAAPWILWVMWLYKVNPIRRLSECFFVDALVETWS